MEPQTTTDLASVRQSLATRISFASVGLGLLALGARTPEDSAKALDYRQQANALFDVVSHATDIATLRQCEASLLEITAKSKQLS